MFHSQRSCPKQGLLLQTEAQSCVLHGICSYPNNAAVVFADGKLSGYFGLDLGEEYCLFSGDTACLSSNSPPLGLQLGLGIGGGAIVVAVIVVLCICWKRKKPNPILSVPPDIQVSTALDFEDDVDLDSDIPNKKH